MYEEKAAAIKATLNSRVLGRATLIADWRGMLRAERVFWRSATAERNWGMKLRAVRNDDGGLGGVLVGNNCLVKGIVSGHYEIEIEIEMR